MDTADKQFFWTLFAIIVGVALACAIGIVHTTRVKNEAQAKDKCTYSVVWHSDSGEVRAYEKTSKPWYASGYPTVFSLPDGTDVEIRSGVLEIKENASVEKP
jgi:predicted outer membrane lipoprotein